jgi:IS5 family transposase
MLFLQALYNLSDEQIKYRVRDRLSFTWFFGLGFEGGIPDGTMLWLFREKLAQAGVIDKLFDRSANISTPRATLRAAGRL